MLELARDRSAGAHPYLVTPDHTAFARQVLGEGPLLAPEQAVVVRSDIAAARRIAREYLATYLGLPNYLSNLRRFGFDDADFQDSGSDRLVDALVPSGGPDQVAARIREHFDAGADHVCIQPLGEARSADLDGMAQLLEATGK
jgi:probable F420-dependent oxidoreductase